MSRGAVGETVRVAPTNNVYTALAGAAVVIQIIGLIALFMRASSVGGLF
jgi:hypothetical protein